MKKTMSAALIMLVVMLLTFVFTSCNRKEVNDIPDNVAVSEDKTPTDSNDDGKETTDTVGDETKEEAKEPESFFGKKSKVNIEDVYWESGMAVVSGYRYGVISYVNNSEYPITRLEITFTEKDGVTEEQRDEYFAEMMEAVHCSDEEEYNEYIERYKGMGIGIHFVSERVVDPGEYVENVVAMANSYRDVREEILFELVEPDIAKINFVRDGKIYTEYYDYKRDEYSVEEKTKDAYEWHETSLSAMLPKPDAAVVESGFFDAEEEYYFTAFGFSESDFMDYVNMCKENGFTVEIMAFDDWYELENSDGYIVVLTYSSSKQTLSGGLNAPME